MKAKRMIALLIALSLLLTLPGCSTQTAKDASGKVWGAVQTKFDDLMGFSQIGEELDKVKTGTATGIKADETSKGSVDLSDGDTQAGADASAEDITVPEASAEDDGGNSSGGLLSNLFGRLSGQGSSSLPDYSFYCEYSDGFKWEIYGYSPAVLRKIWYLDGKFKVTTEYISPEMVSTYESIGGEMPDEGTVYYTVDSTEGFEQIMGYSTPAEAKRAVEDFEEIDSETINGFDCAIYKGTSQNLGEYTGNLYYWIYNYDSSPVIMAHIMRPVINGEETGFGSAEYRYTFGGITAADVTPASGTATDLG